MKKVFFQGSSIDNIRNFPTAARREVGYQLDKVQNGLDPTDWKPMPSVGKGVREIRVKDQMGAYRVIYVVKLEDGIYVLTAFQKKQQKTPKQEIDKAKRNYAELMR